MESLALGGGKIYVSERPEVSIPIAKAAHLLTMSKGPVVAAGSHFPQNPPFNPEFVESNVAPSRPFFSYGAQAVAVQVDFGGWEVSAQVQPSGSMRTER